MFFFSWGRSISVLQTMFLDELHSITLKNEVRRVLVKVPHTLVPIHKHTVMHIRSACGRNNLSQYTTNLSLSLGEGGWVAGVFPITVCALRDRTALTPCTILRTGADAANGQRQRRRRRRRCALFKFNARRMRCDATRISLCT